MIVLSKKILRTASKEYIQHRMKQAEELKRAQVFEEKISDEDLENRKKKLKERLEEVL